jgi:hypothetical protein
MDSESDILAFQEVCNCGKYGIIQIKRANTVFYIKKTGAKDGATLL